METSNIEKLLHVFELKSKSVRRQAVEKDLAVALLNDSGVEQSQHAAVRPRPDQAAKPLLQRNRRLGNLIVVKGIASGLAHAANPRFHHGVVGYRKGQLIDDNAAQLVARNVNALPERRSGKQNA